MALTKRAFEEQPANGELTRLFGLWLAAAEAGEPLAQRMVGDLYRQGAGVAASRPEAVRWLRLAAGGGNNAARTLLASLLLKTDPTAEEVSEAIALLTEAARLGDADAEYNLGVCYRNGIGVSQDSSAAVQLYRQAAAKGQAAAQVALAEPL